MSADQSTPAQKIDNDGATPPSSEPTQRPSLHAEMLASVVSSLKVAGFIALVVNTLAATGISGVYLAIATGICDADSEARWFAGLCTCAWCFLVVVVRQHDPSEAVPAEPLWRAYFIAWLRAYTEGVGSLAMIAASYLAARWAFSSGATTTAHGGL